MKKNTHYCIVLSDSQLDFLAGSKYGIDRMKVLKLLIDASVLEETKYEKKGFSITLHIGQAAFSEVNLATRLDYDKKTVSRILDKMNQLGIVVSTQGNRTSIHTLKCISAWMQDGRRIDNPFYIRLKNRHDDREKMTVISNDTTCAMPQASLDNLNSCSEKKFPTTSDSDLNKADTDIDSYDNGFHSLAEIPVVSDEGELLSPSSDIPRVSDLSQQVAEEETDRNLSN